MKLSFYRGCAISGAGFALLAAFDDRPVYHPSTRIARFDLSEGWREIATRDWYGTAVAARPDGLVAALSQGGDVLLATGHGDVSEERVASGPLLPMNGLAFRHGRLYATGGGGGHFVRGHAGDWAPLSMADFDPAYHAMDVFQRHMVHAGVTSEEAYDALTIAQEDAAIAAATEFNAPIFAIDGPAPDDLYLGGQNGRLLHFDGSRLEPIPTSEKSAFVVVLQRGDKVLVAGGHRGSVILEGNAVVGFAPMFRAPPGQFWLGSLVQHAGVLWAGDPDQGGLWRIADGRAERVAGIQDPVLALDAAGGALWAMTAKALHRLEDGNWTRFANPWI